MKRFLSIILPLLFALEIQAQWVKQTPAATNTEALYSVFAMDTSNIAAIGYTRIMYSNNGGRNWNNSVTFSNAHMYCLHAGDNTIYYSHAGAYGSGNGYQIKLQPNGTVNLTASGKPKDVFGTFHLSLNLGFTVGAGGKIQMTTDGGNTWSSPLPSGTLDTLRGVYFASSSIGYAVGDNGTIVKTTNGGYNWSKLTSGTTNDLRSVWFLSTSNGFVTGSSGIIRKTADGGATWSTIASGTAAKLNSICFPDGSQGYIAGNNGTILQSLDGGATWISMTVPTARHLYSIHFPDISAGWAVGGETGAEEVILRYTGGCIIPPPVINVKTDITCFGANDGTVSAAVTGGIPPYTYSLDGGTFQPTGTFTGLAPGSHNVRAKDSPGCMSFVSFSIFEPPLLNVSTSSTPESAPGAKDGTAAAVPSGGSPPYAFLWDDPAAQTTATATGLGAGTYHVTVTDSSGCTETSSAVVLESTVGVQSNASPLSHFISYFDPLNNILNVVPSSRGEVTILDILGRKIFSSQAGTGGISCRLDGITSGVAVIRFLPAQGNPGAARLISLH